MKRIEKVKYKFHSGFEPKWNRIHHLKRKNYRFPGEELYVTGDAPKDIIDAYFYTPGERKQFKRYIAKGAEKWYPMESVTEYLISRLGKFMEFNVANSQLAVINGQLKFCSEFFLSRRSQQLIHGAEMHSGYLNDEEFIKEIDDKKEERSLISYVFCINSIKHSFKEHPEIVDGFNEMLLHDAIIGNNDRHMYNWGVVNSITNEHPPYFSPIYDSARGLFWNNNEEKILALHEEAQGDPNKALKKYVEKSMPKIHWEKYGDVNHFELLTLIKDGFPEYDKRINQKFFSIPFKKALYDTSKEFNQLMSKERLELILLLLNRRYSELNNILE